MLGIDRSGRLNSDQDVILNDCIIGYVDILGTKEILCSENEERIRDFIRNVQEMYEDLSDEKVHIRIFSDNILFFNDYTEDNVNSIVRIVSETQFYFIIKYGLLIRGAIVRGTLYYNDTFVLGGGLVKAYVTEETRAENPRVLVDDSISHENPRIIKYEDDYILNYLYESYIYEDDYMFPDSNDLQTHKEKLSGLYQASVDEKHKRKQEWSMKYHNWFCEREMIDQEYRILLPERVGVSGNDV